MRGLCPSLGRSLTNNTAEPMAPHALPGLVGTMARTPGLHTHFFGVLASGSFLGGSLG